MHPGNQYPTNAYTMDVTNLTTTKGDRDLGVLIDDQLGFDNHIRNIYSEKS